jgi:lysophospholipid acyltransferase (LPLAT)-like uncharacterized protein
LQGEVIVSKQIEKSLYWYDPILFYAAIPLLSLFIRLLFLSCRIVKIRGLENERSTLNNAKNGVIYASWHQRLFFSVSRLFNRNVTVMISQSRDGEYAARLVNLLGLNDVRGSSTRGGIGALKELVREIKLGANGGMVIDGPLGPPRVAKVGTILLARLTGAPIIPLAWGADRCWVLNSWDRFMIPKPFARISYFYGEPIMVPASSGSEDLENYRKKLENSLNDMTGWCDEQFGKERPWRKEH